jgi:hypothetical protein
MPVLDRPAVCPYFFGLFPLLFSRQFSKLESSKKYTVVRFLRQQVCLLLSGAKTRDKETAHNEGGGGMHQLSHPQLLTVLLYNSVFHHDDVFKRQE